MATETAPVNGLYGANQYGQPAELAASTPSAPTHAASASQSTTTSATQQKADPQEIGWYFVEQYYTTLSKSPEKIHLFYSKKSQLVTGVEAEKVVPAVGTKAISEKIKALDLQDCKVRVLNVDSQASFNNIVVQVIGEMSNKSEPHHKFVQTFVLAEQPNGYFVLNDIFRYLSDDEDEIVEDEQPQAEVPAEEPPTPAAGVTDAPSHNEDVVATEDAVEKVDEKLEEEKIEETLAAEEPAEVNGDAIAAPAEQAPEVTELSGTTEEEVVQESTDTAATEQPAEPEAVTAEPVPEAAAPAPTPAEVPPAKKTWASMLGGGVQKPAVPALPLTPPPQPKAPRLSQPAQAPKAPVEPVPTTANTTSSTPTSQSNGWQTADHSKKSNRPPNRAVSEGITMAYIKNVNDKVDARILREVLERYGELKYFDVSRPRNCAFVEFVDPAGYAAAVAANPHTVGSEQIYVEERRPRPNAYGGSNANFNRGGGTANRGRGGMQGSRSGSQTNFPKDAGRGGGFQRGAKAGTGTVTPKGRGQGQAA
ncbi:Nuclear transport factor 2 NTF2 domain-containing protein [Cladophialophora immunda]|nr:Nuclear transport factor 2 NTF2 domain-containing protein [Cladophialophora immunda]